MIILSLVMILINNAVTNRREMSIFFNRIVIISLIYCILIDLESLNIFTAGYVTPRVGDPTIFGVTTVKEVLEVSSLGLGHEGASMELIENTLSNIGSVGWGLITINHISQIYHIYLYLVSILILIISNSKELKQIEYPLMLLFIIVGGVFLMTTKDLVTIFLAIELQSYGLYLICTMNRNSEYSTTGGLMYFLLGGLSSCIIVLGIGLIYGNSGATNIDGVFLIGSTSPVKEDEYLNISLLLITIGFLFKLGGAPFHYWSPDVYDSIPTLVTTFVAIVAKISIFILIFQLTSAWQLSSIITGSEVDWTYSFIISSLVSIIIGSLLGLTQFRIKKLLAYSTISHIGFILLGLGISSVESYQAFLFYLTQYSISNLNIFLIVLLVGYAYAKKELMKSPIQYISQLKGLYNENTMLTISLAITIFSFIGLPPLLGFYPKQMILSSALDQGYYFIVLVAITASVISAVYYLHIIKETFFLYPEGEGSSNETGGRESLEGRLSRENVESRRGIEKGWEVPRLTLMISIITLLTLTFMFISSSLMNLMQILISY